MPLFDLDRFFNPRSIAVFGASDKADSVGALVFENLVEGGFKGSVHPINPRHKRVRNRRCHAALGDLGKAVDLAVVATPAATVPDIIRQCGEHGVPAALVLSAGFAERGSEGERLLEQALEQARRHGVRILGPNCLGVIRPHNGLNATFSKGEARAGDLALVSQSGALLTAILDWAGSRQVGFSALVSVGAAADVDFGDILDYLALDHHTRSILLYVEGIQHPRRFMSALRAAARLKPVIVVKSGRHHAGSRAARSHTGSLVGADDVFDAALERAGAIRVPDVQSLFAVAAVLASGKRTRGSRLAIVTNAGGPGVLATDRAVEMGLALPALGEDTLARLHRALPAQWSQGNPVDILGDAPPERYREAVAACLEDGDVDGVLVVLTPQAMTDPAAVAEAVVELEAAGSKPVLTCWMGGAMVEAAREVFSGHRIPSFDTPEAAVEAFAYLAAYHRNQELLVQMPGPLGRHDAPDVEGARLILEGVMADDRDILNLTESKAILNAFRIPTARSLVARSANEALVAAESLGFPVALKINSPDITHKSDVGGVRLGIDSAQTVRSTYCELLRRAEAAAPGARMDGVTVERMLQSPNGREVMVGMVRDPSFGPVISFGVGGTAVEVLRDRAVALPPLNRFLVRRLMEQTRVHKLLQSFRSMPAAHMEALEGVLLRLSEMACELPLLREVDLNPVIADENGAMVVDARMTLEHRPPTTDRYGHMAIHPYPAHLVSRWQLADGTDIVIRPIRPEDAQIERSFVDNLSSQSRYFRFMQTMNQLSDVMLIRLTQIDYDREMALIAVTGAADRELEIAVARYAINPDGESCEFALVVADEWQRRGIGTRLMTALMEAAKARGLVTMEGEILSTNANMISLVRSLGFTIHTSPDDPGTKRATRRL